MNSLELIHQAFQQFLVDHFGINPQDNAAHTLTLNVDENRQQFGDLSSNSAMIIAKQKKKNPRDVAQDIINNFNHPLIRTIESAGPGFLNIFLQPACYTNLVNDIYLQQDAFFSLSAHEPKKRYNIEFISANPTGPLHLGHGRGGIIGDVLGTVLQFLGHSVVKEFYINDAGAQIQKLGNSFFIRCQQVLGHTVELPEDAYHGEYLVELAHNAFHAYGSDILAQPTSFFADYAKEQMLNDIKKTVADYGIHFDSWFSEKTLHEGGAIARALTLLEQHNQLYKHDDATWFRSTTYGDDKDRVVQKSSGELTYVAADIAYLRNKVERGAQHMIMILGHDHHSYETRLQAVRSALGIQESLDIILYQLVKMKAGGEHVRMSKRAGNMVTLKDITQTVGTDVARFFYLNRKGDAQLEFDLDLALKTTEENPVFYIQYAYVRTNSILEKSEQEESFNAITADDLIHIGTEEQFLIKKIISLKEVLMTISSHYQTQLLAYYTIELAHAFHKYYAQNRVLDLNNIQKSRARLALLQILNQQFARCLRLLGLSTPQKM